MQPGTAEPAPAGRSMGTFAAAGEVPLNQPPTAVQLDIADRRLSQLGLQPIYRLESNPLPWMDEMLNGMEHTNFFENRATEYSKAATQGTWDQVWDD